MINMQCGNDRLNLDSAVVKIKHLYAVRGIIGKIGEILSTLLAANQPVRAVREKPARALFESQGMLDPLPCKRILEDSTKAGSTSRVIRLERKSSSI